MLSNGQIEIETSLLHKFPFQQFKPTLGNDLDLQQSEIESTILTPNEQNKTEGRKSQTKFTDPTRSSCRFYNLICLTKETRWIFAELIQSLYYISMS